MSFFPVDPGQSLASLLITAPTLAPRLAAHGVDIGCSGHRPAGEVCLRARVDWDSVTRWVGETAAPPPRWCPCARAADMTLPELVTHIVECHHHRVEIMLDLLRPETVRWAHSSRASGTSGRRLAGALVAFANQVRDHFVREQKHAFRPLLELAKADAQPPRRSSRPAIGHPLAALFLDHDHVFDAFGNILTLLEQAPLTEHSGEPGAQVLSGIRDLRAELLQMMHEENNLLFTLGLGLERARAVREPLPSSPRELTPGLLAEFTELRAYRVSGRCPEQ